MNSWHSFSPNGRWLVFSSKRQGPYTRMYLTHLDPDGNDSPAILIENVTASNRAVNLPEFVAIPPDGMRTLGGPVIDYYKLFDRAMYYQKNARYGEAAADWEKVIQIRPDDPIAQGYLGMALMLSGRREEAAPHVRKARELKLAQAVEEFSHAVKLDPTSVSARTNLGRALMAQERVGEAVVELREAIRLAPDYVPALREAAWVLATSPDDTLRNGKEALSLAQRAVEVTGGKDVAVLDALAAAYAEEGQFEEAVDTAHRALAVATAAESGELRSRAALYEARRPFRAPRTD